MHRGAYNAKKVFIYKLCIIKRKCTILPYEIQMKNTSQVQWFIYHDHYSTLKTNYNTNVTCRIIIQIRIIVY